MVVIFPKAHEAEKRAKKTRDRCLSLSIIINQRDYTLGGGLKEVLALVCNGIVNPEIVFILPLGIFALCYFTFYFSHGQLFFFRRLFDTL